MPVVAEILGRVEDVIIGKDGREMVRFHSVFNGLPSIKKAQVIQTDADNILIKIVTDKRLIENDAAIIRSRIESQLGNIIINIEEVSEIPLTENGKFKAVISKVIRNN